MNKSKKRPEARSNAKRTRVFRVGALACALLLAGVVTAVAKYNSKSAAPAETVAAAPTKAQDDYVTVEVGGKKIRVNAQTLQQGPLTQEQAQQMADALEGNKSTEGLVETRHDDGTVEVDLRGRFKSVIVAKRNDDGTVSNSCVDNPEAAKSFLKSDAAAGSPAAGGTAAGRKAVVKH
ncbi:MAG TPA: hypothetical protein VM936_05660 [Pyrinomonadaceae bacterium]|jgi:hypothetical protein|nr:hypothetical protein [Pyrinomonadaceae bacterium]